MKILLSFLILLLTLTSLEAQILVANINQATQDSRPNNFRRWSKGIVFIAYSYKEGNELLLITDEDSTPEVISKNNKCYINIFDNIYRSGFKLYSHLVGYLLPV